MSPAVCNRGGILVCERCNWLPVVLELRTLKSKLEACERDNVKMARALAMANSMILSGEQHSETSEKIIREALSSLWLSQRKHAHQDKYE